MQEGVDDVRCMHEPNALTRCGGLWVSTDCISLGIFTLGLN